MTVKDLVARLSELPEELRVVIDFACVDDRKDIDDEGYSYVLGVGETCAERPHGEERLVELALGTEDSAN